jgi:acyl-CoA synthetase (AMP-forming)/AMP-acid ligase II
VASFLILGPGLLSALALEHADRAAIPGIKHGQNRIGLVAAMAARPDRIIVIGIHDEYRGQSPEAFVKLKAPSSAVTFEQMKDFLKDKLGKHEMISAMEIRDALPRTAVGKLSKRELYDEEARKRVAQK